MKTSDRKIMNQLRKGNIKSFEFLFHQFHPGLVLYAGSILKNSELAEEVVQDVFYNIWKNRREFRLTTSWKSYLFKSVYNNSLMEIRKMKREIPMDEEKFINENNISVDASGEIQKEELNEVIEKTLNSLPERTKEIFTLSRFEGLKYKEIALKLTISVKTVEANMARALKAFRISLKEHGY